MLYYTSTFGRLSGCSIGALAGCSLWAPGWIRHRGRGGRPVRAGRPPRSEYFGHLRSVVSVTPRGGLFLVGAPPSRTGEAHYAREGGARVAGVLQCTSLALFVLGGPAPSTSSIPCEATTRVLSPHGIGVALQPHPNVLYCCVARVVHTCATTKNIGEQVVVCYHRYSGSELPYCSLNSNSSTQKPCGYIYICIRRHFGSRLLTFFPPTHTSVSCLFFSSSLLPPPSSFSSPPQASRDLPRMFGAGRLG